MRKLRIFCPKIAIIFLISSIFEYKRGKTNNKFIILLNNFYPTAMSYRRVRKDSDELFYTTRSLVKVRNQLPAQVNVSETSSYNYALAIIEWSIRLQFKDASRLMRLFCVICYDAQIMSLIKNFVNNMVCIQRTHFVFKLKILWYFRDLLLQSCTFNNRMIYSIAIQTTWVPASMWHRLIFYTVWSFVMVRNQLPAWVVQDQLSIERMEKKVCV